MLLDDRYISPGVVCERPLGVSGVSLLMPLYIDIYLYALYGSALLQENNLFFISGGISSISGGGEPAVMLLI